MGTPKFLRYSIRRGLANRTLGPSGGQVYPPVYQYNFDGIDDYIQLPTITLFAGDVVEIDFKNWSTGYILDRPASSLEDRPYILWQSGTVRYNTAVFSELLLDGVIVVNLTTPVPVDDDRHSLRCTVSSNCDLGLLGTSYLMSTFFAGVIKNIRITRANPTDQYPDLFWPIDDGAGTTIIRQTIPHTHKIDGTESFDSDGAIWLDYETEAAPQYVGVTGYETLAERAVLSGLSEHDEAFASCREGLVRNGNFRFGDNGQWNLQSDWSITNSEAHCNTDGTPGNRDLTQFGVLEIGEEYILSLNISNYTSGSLYLYHGTSSLLGSSQGRVKITFTPTVDRIVLFGNPFVGVIDDVQVRKATDQQVLSPYVNQGTPVNFNDERWERV